MNNTRRTVIKTTSALGTLVALGLVTQQQAMAAARAGAPPTPPILLAKSLAPAAPVAASPGCPGAASPRPPGILLASNTTVGLE